MDVKETSRETILCLVAAHVLVTLDDGTFVGDPMDKTTLDALEWTLGKGWQHSTLMSEPILILLGIIRGHCHTLQLCD